MSDQERLQRVVQELREYGYDHSGYKELEQCTAIEAADLIDQLQRERQEPEQLTDEQIDQMVGKPIFVIHKSSLDGRVTRGWYVVCETKNGTAYCTDGEAWFNAQNCQIYATEPKGEHHD